MIDPITKAEIIEELTLAWLEFNSDITSDPEVQNNLLWFFQVLTYQLKMSVDKDTEQGYLDAAIFRDLLHKIKALINWESKEVFLD